jgi:outer membrane protein TolC
MRDLEGWMMLQKIYKLLFLLPIFLYSSENYKDILSSDIKERNELQKQKNEQDNFKNRFDWISSIQISHVQSDGDHIDKSRYSKITISQPIFKSGGIYNAIKYSEAYYKYQKLNIDNELRNDIMSAYKALFNIKKIDLQIKKSKLNLENAKIAVKQRKNELLNGLIDVTQLNEEIIKEVNTKIGMIDLQTQREEQINRFNNLSSKSYTSFELPKLDIVNEEEFVKNNFDIKHYELDSDVKYRLKNITLSTYLPSVSLDYSYKHDHIEGNDNPDTHTYGFTITMPISVTSYSDYQSKKIEYLIAKKNKELAMINAINDIKSKLLKVNNYDKKVEVKQHSIQAYLSLIKQLKEHYNAGLTTLDDLTVMENTKKVEELDIGIYNLEKQIELLDIYADMTSNMSI